MIKDNIYKKTPRVSVVMAIYKEPVEWMRLSIESILNQTFRDFEFIIINDNPQRHENINILNEYASKDNRVIVLKNDYNIGLTKSLNKGLNIARGEYVARMDADDIAVPNRFEKQIAYMDLHRDVVVCGGQIQYLGKVDYKYPKLLFPLTDELLKERLAISTCFAHPVVMMRKQLMGNIVYDETFRISQDYSMWCDLIDNGKYANLPDILLMYRVSNCQISQNYNSIREETVMRCHSKYLCHYLDESLVHEILNSDIDIVLIKRIKAQTSNKGILSALYLSLYKYNFSSLVYLLFSFDVFTIGLNNFIRFIKRLLLGKQPIYYKVNTHK